MRNEGGYACITLPDGRLTNNDVANLNGTRVHLTGTQHEMSTFSCFHCNRVVHVPPRADVNFVGFCRSCMKPICAECSAKPCSPWEEKMARAEAAYHARRSYGLE